MVAIARVKTGIPSLDAIMGGGLPPQSNILVYGEPLCGKKPLIMQYIYQGLQEGMPGMFVLTDYGVVEWANMMRQGGWNLETVKDQSLIHFVDAYTKQFQPGLEDNPNIAYVEHPSAISSVALHISSMQDEILKAGGKEHRLAFHSISSLLEECDSKTVFNFLHYVTGKFRMAGATALYTMEKGMHSPVEVNMVEHLMDGIIEFEGENVKVKGIFGSDAQVHAYKITPRGITIKV
jgi:KaiC/GvpD/RAD55 family RecA-like ATPase